MRTSILGSNFLEFTRRTAWRCSFVMPDQDQILLLLIFIVENSCLQILIEPNIHDILAANFQTLGKSFLDKFE